MSMLEVGVEGKRCGEIDCSGCEARKGGDVDDEFLYGVARKIVESLCDIFYDPDPRIDGYTAEEMIANRVESTFALLKREFAKRGGRL